MCRHTAEFQVCSFYVQRFAKHKYARVGLYSTLSLNDPFKPKVEKDKTCQRWLQQCYPTSCLFPDVLKLIHNEIPQDRVLSPAEVRFRNKAHCLTHGRDCRIPLNKNSRLVLGAPCVLFSRLTGCIIFLWAIREYFVYFLNTEFPQTMMIIHNFRLCKSTL